MGGGVRGWGGGLFGGRMVWLFGVVLVGWCVCVGGGCVKEQVFDLGAHFAFYWCSWLHNFLSAGQPGGWVGRWVHGSVGGMVVGLLGRLVDEWLVGLRT